MMQIADMTTRQKIVIGVFVLVVIFLIWQVIGLMRGSGSTQTIQPVANSTTANMAPSMPTPKPASLAKPAVLSEREQALMNLQKQTEEKYVAALNELQMLKIQKDVAETNKAIASANLDTVKAQKGVVDILSKPAVSQAAYAQNLAGAGGSAGSSSAQSSAATPSIGEASYIIISVSKLQGKWNAVLGYQGKLFNVAIGDVLPADGSKVVDIDKSGVSLEKDGNKKKISLLSNI